MLVAFDVVGFGDPARDDEVQRYLRRMLYEILENSFNDAGIPWRGCLREDRGDGVLVLITPGTPTTLVIDPLCALLRARLREHNKWAHEIARLRLRMAVHTGHVLADPNGLSGRALILLFRLLDAPEFKDLFATTPIDFGLITSDRLYDDVIRHGPGLIDPEDYRGITVHSKETCARAWVHIPCPCLPGIYPARTDGLLTGSDNV